MIYIKFIMLFIIAHVVSYTVAGNIVLPFSKDIYEHKDRVCDFLRNMADSKERKHVEKHFFPAQILRGFLMGIVLLPLLSDIKNHTFITQFIFLGSLMFIYTDISSASPFISNIEGQVYFKKEYLVKGFFFKFQFEMLMYSTLFGLIMTLFLHFFI